jgi:hypothetical protein
MFDKNLNSTSRFLRILLGLSLATISLITFTPQHYLSLYVLGLIGFWILISGILGWSPIYGLTDKSDFPTHLNKFSKKEMQEALK